MFIKNLKFTSGQKAHRLLSGPFRSLVPAADSVKERTPRRTETHTVEDSHSGDTQAGGHDRRQETWAHERERDQRRKDIKVKFSGRVGLGQRIRSPFSISLPSRLTDRTLGRQVNWYWIITLRHTSWNVISSPTTFRGNTNSDDKSLLSYPSMEPVPVLFEGPRPPKTCRRSTSVTSPSSPKSTVQS